MTRSKTAPAYKANRNYTRKDWDEVSDNPPLTADELANLKPASEVLPPAIFEGLAKRRPGQRGPGRKLPKVAVTLRLDPDIVAAFKREGEGWQTRINDTLRRSVVRRASREA